MVRSFIFERDDSNSKTTVSEGSSETVGSVKKHRKLTNFLVSFILLPVVVVLTSKRFNAEMLNVLV